MATKRRPAGIRLKPWFLEEWLIHLKVSDIELARRLGVARETIWRYQANERQPNPRKIAAIAEALGIEPAQLLRPPPGPHHRASIDAMLKDAPDDVHSMAVDIVSRVIGKK